MPSVLGMRGHPGASPRAQALMGGGSPFFSLGLKSPNSVCTKPCTLPRSPVEPRWGQCHVLVSAGCSETGPPGVNRGPPQAPPPASRAVCGPPELRLHRVPAGVCATCKDRDTKLASGGHSTPGFPGSGLRGRQSQSMKAICMDSDTQAQNWGITERISGAPSLYPIPLCAECRAHDWLPIHQWLLALSFSAPFPSQLK